MALNITTRLTITQAALMFCVVALAGIAVYVFTEDSLVGESVKAAELEAYHASQELFEQLDADILVEFSVEPLPFREARVSQNHWAVVRGHGETVLSHGVFADGGGRPPRGALDTGIIDVGGGRFFRVVSLPFPKLRSERFEELPRPVQEAVRREQPGALYLRTKHESARGGRVREIELVSGYEFREIKVAAEGEVMEKESVRLPQSLPGPVVKKFFGVDSAGEVPVSWTAHDSQLLMAASLPEAGDVLVNRYLERFLLGERGEISGPTRETALRLLVATEVTDVARALNRLVLGLVTGGAVVWLLTVAIGWFVIRRAFSPVRRILAAANRIEPTHLDTRLPTGKVRDELYSIAATINLMLDRIENGFRREQRFTGNASHELRGPLAKIIAEIDVALTKDRQPEEYRDALERCRRYAGGLQGIVESLLLLTRLDRRSDAVGAGTIDIQSVLINSTRSLPGPERCRVRLELWPGEAPILVRGKGELLGVLVRNLLENALRYSPVEEGVVLRLRYHRPSVLLEIEDRGQGIPDETRERVFDRFYRLDASRSRGTGGAGLGLSIVRSIARAHGGDVSLAASPSGGTLATVSLPAAPDGSDGGSGSAATDPPVGTVRPAKGASRGRSRPPATPNSVPSGDGGL